MSLSLIERDVLRTGAQAAVETVFLKADKIYRRNFIRPKVTFSKKGRAAAYASYTHWEIQINEILYQENIADFLTETIPHEVAHLVAYEIHGKAQQHNHIWRAIAISLGCNGKRCHNYDTTNSKRKTRRWGYVCPACGENYVLSTTLHNRQQRLHEAHRHRGCKKNHSWTKIAYTRQIT